MSIGIDLLRKDHQLTTRTAWPIIYRVLIQLKEGQQVSHESLDGLVEFLNDYFLEHHVPLESALIEAAVARGVGHEQLIRKVAAEHEQVRNYVQALANALQAVAAGDVDAVDKCVDCGSEFIDFFLRHEAEEDSKLFPVIEPVLTETDDLASIEAVETQWEENDSYTHFQAMLKRVEAEIIS